MKIDGIVQKRNHFARAELCASVVETRVWGEPVRRLFLWEERLANIWNEPLYPGRTYQFNRPTFLYKLQIPRTSQTGLAFGSNRRPGLSFQGISDFCWYPPLSQEWGKSPISVYSDLSGDYILVWGSEILNWAASEENWGIDDFPNFDPQGDIELPSGFLLSLCREVWQRLMREDGTPLAAKGESITGPCCLEQGHLLLYPVSYPLPRDLYFSRGYPRKILFNHYFEHGDVLGWLGADDYLINVHRDGLVIADDHPAAFLPRGWYVAEHPLPRNGRVD